MSLHSRRRFIYRAKLRERERERNVNAKEFCPINKPAPATQASVFRYCGRSR